MRAWTDYPFTVLGDEPYKKAPIREIEVISYDGNKYCKIIVSGVDEIKAGATFTPSLVAVEKFRRFRLRNQISYDRCGVRQNW